MVRLCKPRLGLCLVLYTGGGVLVWQGIVAVAGDGCSGGGRDRRVGVERVEWLHAADGAGDHGDGVGCHQWHILRRSPQGQRVVRWAHGRPQGFQVTMDTAGREGRAMLQLHPLLLHLQRHQLLLLTQRQVIVRWGPYYSHANTHAHRRATLRGQSAVASLHKFMALIPFVIKRSKGQHIQEKKRGAYSYRHAQLGGVVPSLTGEGRVRGSLRTIRLRIRWIGGDHRVACGAGACAGASALPAVGAPKRQVSCAGDIEFVKAVQMWHQLQPEGHLVGPVVVSDARLQADMQILLVFGAEFGPDDLLKAVGLSVDKGGVLRNR